MGYSGSESCVFSLRVEGFRCRVSAPYRQCLCMVSGGAEIRTGKALGPAGGIIVEPRSAK